MGEHSTNCLSHHEKEMILIYRDHNQDRIQILDYVTDKSKNEMFRMDHKMLTR